MSICGLGVAWGPSPQLRSGVLCLSAGTCLRMALIQGTPQLLQTIPEPSESPQVWACFSSGMAQGPCSFRCQQETPKVMPGSCQRGTQGGVHSGSGAGSVVLGCSAVQGDCKGHSVPGAREGLGDHLAAGRSTLKPPNSLSSVFAHARPLSLPASGASRAGTAPLRVHLSGLT